MYKKKNCAYVCVHREEGDFLMYTTPFPPFFLFLFCFSLFLFTYKPAYNFSSSHRRMHWSYYNIKKGEKEQVANGENKKEKRREKKGKKIDKNYGTDNFQFRILYFILLLLWRRSDKSHAMHDFHSFEMINTIISSGNLNSKNIADKSPFGDLMWKKAKWNEKEELNNDEEKKNKKRKINWRKLEADREKEKSFSAISSFAVTKIISMLYTENVCWQQKKGREIFFGKREKSVETREKNEANNN